MAHIFTTAKLHVDINGAAQSHVFAISQGLSPPFTDIPLHSRDTFLTELFWLLWVHANKASSPDSHLNVSSFNVLAKMRYQVAIVVAGACSAFASPHTLRERNIVDDIQDSYDFVIVGGKSSRPVHKAVR